MQRSVLTTLAMVAVLGMAGGVLMLSRGDSHVYTDDLSDPVRVADSYIHALLRKDLVRIAYYWTGDPKAYENSFFGRFTPSVLRAARREALPLENYRWRLGPARVEGGVALVRVELEIIDTTAIAARYEELRGLRPDKDGRMPDGPPDPNLTVEEAWRLARNDPSVGWDRFEHDLRLNRTGKGWLIDMEADDRLITILYRGYDPDADPDR
ncbi:hypothetical protein [Calidithermus roseus]|uniref:Uncharacterized protein n=1 Tax=Calidithermus roseus TaxID=1644118 RepID=A0A399ELP0_9DEIN|nr:hypothetical protein [Calidithermus roseus]RIH84393.1 hypothetical protein Mrose_02659 [Calidithermus roseus]